MESVAAPTPASPSTSTILDMPKELLDQILEKYVPDVARHISIDNRSSLSVESVTSTPPPLEGSGNQRLDIWVHSLFHILRSWSLLTGRRVKSVPNLKMQGCVSST